MVTKALKIALVFYEADLEEDHDPQDREIVWSYITNHTLAGKAPQDTFSQNHLLKTLLTAMGEILEELY